MMIDDYKPNSHKYKAEMAAKAEKKKVEKVVSGKVKTKKKGEISKLKDVFISEDVSNVKSYIFMDVLVPAVKKAISDIVRDGVDMILYGESRGKKSSGTYVSYRDYSKNTSNASRASLRSNFEYDDLYFETRGEAEAVLEQLEEILERYGVVSVADMYDAAGLTAPYTANKYGWMSLRTAEPVRTRDGYIIKLPKASPID